MTWQPLASFRDPSVPKLDNLRRAAAARIRVPPTWWLPARSLDAATPPPLPVDLGSGPIILRSGSPTEDTRATSNAGQLLSLIVERPEDYPEALRQVVAALPGEGGQPTGAVFAQPVVQGEEAGVSFFDGFYYERTRTAGRNTELTSGHLRGEVTRGGLVREDPWSDWLVRLHGVFAGKPGDPALDVEYARDAAGYVLLQVRPALFGVKRNPLLTQANVKETFGDWPSPFTVSGMLESARDRSFLTLIEPAIHAWQEEFALEVGERIWINLSLWLRWADHLGLPRTIPLKGIGSSSTRADHRIIWHRLPRGLWRVLVGQVRGLGKILAAPRELARLDRRIASAKGLVDLYHFSIEAWILGWQTAVAIAGVLASIVKVRTLLHLPGRARLVTHDMMEEYRQLAALPPDRREAGLDVWLSRHGHRGPGESDVARPRFADLRAVLLADLHAASPPPAAPRPSFLTRLGERIFWPAWWLDGRREWFRGECMRRLQKLRQRLLEEGQGLVAQGLLDEPADVFWLRGGDLDDPTRFRAVVTAARARLEAAQRISWPLTADLETLTGLLDQAERTAPESSHRTSFAGIALTSAVFEGEVRRAHDLVSLLGDSTGLGSRTVLVVPSLEPSWAVLFPRIGGVIAEVGGELSHASILLREAGKPAIVNVAGIYAQLRDGERVRLDGKRGRVERLDETTPGVGRGTE